MPAKRLMLSAFIALVLVLPGPVAALAGHHHPAIGVHRLVANSAGAAFVFGRQGGNIIPFAVTIENNGTIHATGPIHLLNPHVQLSSDALKGLLKLAEAESFFSMKSRIGCAGTLPDVASVYITINTTSGSKTVSVHGGCNASFTQLFSVLTSVAGVSYQ